MKTTALLTASLMILTIACSKSDQGVAPGTASPTVAEYDLEKSSQLDPDDPSILMRPFTADQIRVEMVVGLRVMTRRSTPEGVSVELWNVVEADEHGVVLEISLLDEDQEIIGEPDSQRATWTELRDHASFPAASSTREWVTMDTDLGLHEGWFYSVEGETPGVINEFFFAAELPGAPVIMRILQDGHEVFTMEQFVRMRPATP